MRTEMREVWTWHLPCEILRQRGQRALWNHRSTARRAGPTDRRSGQPRDDRRISGLSVRRTKLARTDWPPESAGNFGRCEHNPDP